MCLTQADAWEEVGEDLDDTFLGDAQLTRRPTVGTSDPRGVRALPGYPWRQSFPVRRLERFVCWESGGARTHWTTASVNPNQRALRHPSSWPIGTDLRASTRRPLGG